MADSTEEYVTPAAPPPETGEGSAALSADSSDEKCEASPPVPDADIADIVPRSTVDAAPTDAPSSMDAVLAEGAATQIKYSAAGGGPIVHPVPPMPTLEAALGPGFARPTHAWYGRLGVDTDVLEPYREASVRHGALESTLRKAPPTLGDGASGSAAPPSFLERAQRPRLRDRVEEYVGVAHARIQWEDPSDEDEGGARKRADGDGKSAHRPRRAVERAANARHEGRQRADGAQEGVLRVVPRVASQRSAPTPSAALGHRKPAPSARARAVPREAEEVLARDASALLEADGMSAALQVQGVIRSIEDELGELNLQYKRTVASLQRQAGGAPGAGGEEALHARIRGLVLRMEEKGAQLSSLRGRTPPSQRRSTRCAMSCCGRAARCRRPRRRRRRGGIGCVSSSSRTTARRRAWWDGPPPPAPAPTRATTAPNPRAKERTSSTPHPRASSTSARGDEKKRAASGDVREERDQRGVSRIRK